MKKDTGCPSPVRGAEKTGDVDLTSFYITQEQFGTLHVIVITDGEVWCPEKCTYHDGVDAPDASWMARVRITHKNIAYYDLANSISRQLGHRGCVGESPW